MLSSLSKWGSARCYDSLKYGAVDFVSKSSFFKGIDGTAHSKLVIGKVHAAANMTVYCIDPMQTDSNSVVLKNSKKVLFCEECGTRNSSVSARSGECFVICKKCGDEISLNMDQRYRRMNFLTVMGSGASGYCNILKIIPSLSPDMGGAVFVMILDAEEHVKSFVKYLDSISNLRVTKGADGVTVEGGCCYIFSGEQRVSLTTYSGAYSMHVEKMSVSSEETAVNILMDSAVSFLGGRVLGILLSGDTLDGASGMQQILDSDGSIMILNPDHCLHKTMVREPCLRHNLSTDFDESLVSAKIRKKHFSSKEKVVTA